MTAIGEERRRAPRPDDSHFAWRRAPDRGAGAHETAPSRSDDD
jgi:hypothetical protein